MDPSDPTSKLHRARRLVRVPRRSVPLLATEMAGQAFSWSALMTVMLFQGLIARKMGAGVGQLTLLQMAVFLGFSLAGASDRLTRRVNLGQAVFMLRLGACAMLWLVFLVNTAAGFVMLIVLMRMFEGSTISAQKALPHDYYPPQARGKLLSWTRIIGTAALVALMMVTGWALELRHDAYRWVMPGLGVALLLGSLPYALLPDRAARRRHRRRRAGLGDALRVLREDKHYRTFLLIFCIGTFGEKFLMPLNPILFENRYGMTYKQLAGVMGLAGPIASILGFLFWGRFINRRNAFTVLTICMFVKVLRPLLFAFAPVGSHIGWLATGEAIFRFTLTGLELSSVLAYLGMADSVRTPQYVSLHFWFIAVRGITGPVIGWGLYSLSKLAWPGAEYDTALTAVYLFAAVVILAGGVGIAWFNRVDRRQLDEAETRAGAGTDGDDSASNP